MAKTICHFKDELGPVVILTDSIRSIEVEEDAHGGKYTLITTDIEDSENNCREFSVDDSVVSAIAEWERGLKQQNA